MSMREMVESGAYYDLRAPAYSIGMRSGERDGYVVDAGRVYEHGPAGHADGRYPYGHAVRDVTEEALRREEAHIDAAKWFAAWRSRHPILARIKLGCHYTRVEDGVCDAHVPLRGGADWRTAGEIIAALLRAVGYEVELHPSPINAGKITARRSD